LRAADSDFGEIQADDAPERIERFSAMVESFTPEAVV